MENGKIIIFSAPSGAGKSTIVKHLLDNGLNLDFSISATSRAPRGSERNGVEYYFLTPDEFKTRIANDEFVEYEEVYKDCFYGTLRSELTRIWSLGHHIVFDVDVVGGVNLKRIFGDKALSIFIQPPSVEELRRRLIGRATDSADKIEQRLAKAETELTYAPQFDEIIINDDLSLAKSEAEKLVRSFID